MPSLMSQIHPCPSCSPPTLMQIMAVAQTQDTPLVPILSRSGLELFLGSPSDNPLLHCQQPKPNTWLHATLEKRLSGCARCCRSFSMPTLSVLYMDNQSAIQVAKHPQGSTWPDDAAPPVLVLAARCGGLRDHFTHLCAHWRNDCCSAHKGIALPQSGVFLQADGFSHI